MDRGALEQLKAEAELELAQRARNGQPVEPALALLAMIRQRLDPDLDATSVQRRMAVAIARSRDTGRRGQHHRQR